MKILFLTFLIIWNQSSFANPNSDLQQQVNSIDEVVINETTTAQAEDTEDSTVSDESTGDDSEGSAVTWEE
jgi:hypothetical protein